MKNSENPHPQIKQIFLSPKSTKYPSPPLNYQALMYVKEFNSILTSRVKKSFCVLLVVVTGFSKKPYFKPLLLAYSTILHYYNGIFTFGLTLQDLLIANSFDKTLPTTINFIFQNNSATKW